MTEQRTKDLSKLATRLQVLRSEEKNKYLYELEEYAKDCKVRERYKQQLDIFFPHRLACQVYYSLEGTPYTQPEFASQATWKDVLARKKFCALFAGITAYAQASAVEKDSFQKRALSVANPIKMIVYAIKTRQNGLA